LRRAAGAAPCCEEGARTGRLVEGLVALVMGDIHAAPPLVRIHSQCLTGDVFGSLRCDCRLQLELALSKIAEEARAFCSTSSRRAAASA